MPGPKLQLVKKECLAFLYLLWIFSSNAVASDNSILIIKSHESQFFNQSIENLINNTEHKVKFNIINAEAYPDKQQDFDPRVIITLGKKAAQLTTHIENNTPVIHSYLTDFQLSGHGRERHHYNVLLDQPLARYFRFIKLLLSSAQDVGLIKTEINKYPPNSLSALENSIPVKINQYIFHPDDNPINLVRNILRTNDVLLSLPEPEVYNHQTLKGILLSSYRLNKPLISYSPAHVKSGALAAIYTSPIQIGKQVAELLNKLLSGEADEVKQINYAREFQISINWQVAHSLKIDLPSQSEVTQQLIAGEAQ